MCFGHGHLRFVSHDSNAGTLADAHAAAHHNTVHECDIGLCIGVNQMIQCVFFCKEICQTLIASQSCLVKESNITTGTKVSEGTFFAVAAHQHSQHLGIVLELYQGFRQIANHVKRQRIQCFGTIERDAPYSTGNFFDDQRTGVASIHVRHCVVSIQTIHFQTKQQSPCCHPPTHSGVVLHWHPTRPRQCQK